MAELNSDRDHVACKPKIFFSYFEEKICWSFAYAIGLRLAFADGFKRILECIKMEGWYQSVSEFSLEVLPMQGMGYGEMRCLIQVFVLFKYLSPAV